MASDIVIRNVVYEGCPEVDIPKQGGGTARFTDTSDATLNNASQMLNGVTAYAGGVKYTGNIQSRSAADLTASGDTVIVPAGNYATQATKAVASGAVTAPAAISASSANVSTGTNTLTLSKIVSVTPNLTTPGYIADATAGNANVTLTANVTTKAAATITPGTSAQTIPAGTYLTGAQTIEGDSELKGANIVAGKTIFNVAGTAQVPVISQDSVTKIVSIS